MAMMKYEAFRQARIEVGMDSRARDAAWRKRAIAERAARLMGVEDEEQLSIAWKAEARRSEDLFRMVMKGVCNAD